MATFFFSGPTQTIQAEDEGEVIEGSLSQRERLLDRVERCLRGPSGKQRRVVVGAIPFCDRAPVRLFCPRTVCYSGHWSVAPSPHSSEPFHAIPRVPNDRSLNNEPFLNAVRGAVDEIQRGALRKVVLSRVQDVPLARSPNPLRLLRRLRAKNPHAFTFALALAASDEVPGHVLLGASPELLVSRRGSRVVSSPLAGSAPRSADPQEDGRRAAQLLRSTKDRHEHQLVVAQILDDLRPFVQDLQFEREPLVVSTASLWHLSTRIEGKLRDPDVSALRLALALHPPPAVCGPPTAAARAFIREREGFDRGYFTGALGHVDQNGDGDWIVTIRCAELGSERARVFAGAGIVGSSVAELELIETNVKMRTMLEALGVAGPADRAGQARHATHRGPARPKSAIARWACGRGKP
jgi:isochorismate synthase